MTLRWGILGAGKFGRTVMGPAIHAATDAQLVAVATSDPAKAVPFQRMAPGVRVSTGYDDLLADDGVDAVYIPLPNHLHVPWTLKALKAGKHVLCEKPIAMAAADIDALIARRDETGLVAAEAYMIAHHPMWHRVRHLLADGAIGALRHVNAVFTYNNPDGANIRFDAAKGGGSLPDIGVYTLGCVGLATGQAPVAVTHADLEMVGGVDMSARVGLRYDGFTVQSFTAMNTHAAQEVTFFGDLGNLTVQAPFNAGSFAEAQIRLSQASGGTRVERWPGVNQYVEQVEAFGRAVRGEEVFGWSLENAKATQSVLDQVFERAGHGEAGTQKEI